MVKWERIQTSHLKSAWARLFIVEEIYLSAVYDYLCSYVTLIIILNVAKFHMICLFAEVFWWAGGSGHMLENI